MTRLTLFLRRLPLILILTAISATLVVASSTVGSGREKRHVGVGESGHRAGKVLAPESGAKSSSGTNNEITAEPGRKVSHRLIGGHLRVDAKRNESLWDDGILMSAAGDGKEGKNARGSGEDDDEKKTLSQQVKEGKYGLIQNEIYAEQPKRPGIISYLGNPEVPKDTADNLGGLDEEEIWLAENHVLVLRGGKFPERQDGQQSSDSASPKWPPIDDYKAPRRQVKIPSRPRIPPPFPVQLTEGGPIQIIGPNGTTDVDNATLDYSADLYAKGLFPGETPLFLTLAPNGTLLNPDLGPPQNFSVVEEKSSRGNNERKRVKPDAPPFYHAIPPGAVFVPPPGNQSDYDDDDQSIYYPPPYSFYYPRDNTTAVPPGPLVPGMILPPPPDFFSALDDKKGTTKKYTKQPSTTTNTITTTPSSRTRPTYLPPRKFTTTKQHKSSSPVTSTSVTKSVSSSSSSTAKVPVGRTMIRNVTNAFAPRRKTVPIVETTTATSGKPNTLENTEIYTINPVIGNQVFEATTQQKDWSTLVTKTVPVLAYYPSTTQSSLERPVEVTPVSVKSIVTTGQPGRSNHASYYFYEESSSDGSSGVTKPSPVYYETTTESPYYNVEPRQPEQKKHYYDTETIEAATPKDYKTKLTDDIVKNSQTFRYTDSEITSSKFDEDSSRSQGQRMLSDQPPAYYHQLVPARRPNHQQAYYTTPKPQIYHRQSAKPKPIYQYSFQVADYSKRGDNRKPSYQREEIVYDDYQDVKSGDHQYDYDIDAPSQGRAQKGVPFDRQRPIYPSTDTYSIADTTANPQHAYFTQQDEKLLDDVTKEYFTIFGKKLPDNAGGIPNTTPIYGKSSAVTEKPQHDANGYIYKTGRPVTAYKTPNVKVHYGDQAQARPYSLKDDTLVNYRRPLPPINPDSEFVEPKRRPLPSSNYQSRAENYRLREQNVQQHGPPTPHYGLQETIQPTNGHTGNNFVPFAESREELEEPAKSLLSDIEVNFRNPRPPVNPDAEFIEPVVPVHDDRSDNPNAYFAYRLPGDVGHFYFLTPQAITQQQDQNAGYVYPKPRGSRLLRRRRRPGNV